KCMLIRLRRSFPRIERGGIREVRIARAPNSSASAKSCFPYLRLNFARRFMPGALAFTSAVAGGGWAIVVLHFACRQQVSQRSLVSEPDGHEKVQKCTVASLTRHCWHSIGRRPPK